MTRVWADVSFAAGFAFPVAVRGSLPSHQEGPSAERMFDCSLIEQLFSHQAVHIFDEARGEKNFLGENDDDPPTHAGQGTEVEGASPGGRPSWRTCWPGQSPGQRPR